ncbi:hypothetical protein H0X09_03835 [Candidatus Saccharibacteria bacterium]|nr:hypothetical protein [Candidatus Saccharibacteria bacterium]
MEDIYRRDVDRILFKNNKAEESAGLAKQVFSRAYSMIKGLEPVRRSGINWTQDDDPILTVKEKPVTYQSENGSCMLVLTNMYQGEYCDSVNEDILSLEILPAGSSYEVTEDPKEHERWLRRDRGEVLFTISKDGDIASPLVNAELASTFLDLFIESQEPDTS